jgi:hypothetical protein
MSQRMQVGGIDHRFPSSDFGQRFGGEKRELAVACEIDRLRITAGASSI